MVTFGVAVPVLGQTAVDLGARYQTLRVYEVGPDILMTARFAVDGQVCEMALEPRRYQQKANTIVSGATLSRDRLEGLIDELVPEAERGKRAKDPLEGFTSISGHSTSTSFNYEKITVTLYGSIGDPIVENGLIKGFARGTGEEIAIITWRNRTCSAP